MNLAAFSEERVKIEKTLFLCKSVAGYSAIKQSINNPIDLCYFRVCQSGEILNEGAFFPCILIFLLYKTNRFHVAVRLFSNRSQMTSKCGKDKKVAHEAQPSVSLIFLPHFDFPYVCSVIDQR